MTELRAATPSDADDMTEVQNAIHASGLRPALVDADLVRERYLAAPNRWACTVAVRDGRGGVGRALFAVSLAAAREAGLEHIDASIGASNAGGIAYYQALGFRPYRAHGDVLAHRFDV